MDPMTKAFVADIHGFVAARRLERSLRQGTQRRVAQQFLARFTGTEGVLRRPGAEKALVGRTQRRYNQAGEPYASLGVSRRHRLLRLLLRG